MVKNNIMDYLAWRGDLTFGADKFSDADGLILCQIGYIHFDGLCFPEYSSRHSFCSLSEQILSSNEMKMKYTDVGLMNKKIPELFFAAAKSNRFKDVQISCFLNKYTNEDNLDNQEQFAALTYILNEKQICVVFRGTDDSIVGWKEDFNLAQMNEIPGQKDALAYLDATVDAFPDKQIIVAGHSKGGNVALYACAKIAPEKQAKIIDIYNYDGPGFSKERLESSGFRAIKSRVHTWYPEQSIVGMLFNHFDNFKVAKSHAISLMQHDLMTWDFMGKKIVEVNELHPGSVYLCDTFNEWYINLPEEKKKTFIDSLFSILESPKQKTMAEMFGNAQNEFRDASYSIKESVAASKEYAENSRDELKSALKEHNVIELGKSAIDFGKSVGSLFSGFGKSTTKSVSAIGKNIGGGAKTVASMTKATAKVISDKEQMAVIYEIVKRFTIAGTSVAVSSGKDSLGITKKNQA